jgi:hypothetical protein
MPMFPRYNSSSQLTTQKPQPDAPQDAEGAIQGQLAKTFQSAQGAVVQMAQAQKSMQNTTAEANLKSSIMDQEEKAALDPDYNNSEEHMAAIDKAYEQSGAAGTTANLELKLQAQASKIKIRGIYQKKQIMNDQVNTKKLIDIQTANPTTSSMGIIQSLLKEKVALGIFDQEEAYKLERKANDDLGKNRVNQDLYTAETPERIDEIAQGITGGEYEKGGVTLDSTDKKNFLEIADRAKENLKKKNAALQTQAMVKNRLDVLTGIASGSPDYQNIDVASIAEYDPQLANTLTKVKDFMVNYNPKLPPKEQALSSAGLMTEAQIKGMRSYARSVMDTFLQNDNEKLSDFVMRELEKKGDGMNQSVKLAAFTNLAFLKSKVNDPQTPEDAKLASRFNAIKAGVKFLQTANPYLSSSAIGEFIAKNYLSGAGDTEKVMAEAKSVLKDKIIDRYASVAKLPGLPNKIVDGEASVEDLQSGANELESDEAFSGSYDEDSGSD